MTTRYFCALDGVRMDTLDERICITDIWEEAPKMRWSVSPLLGAGSRVLSRVRERLSVSVRFLIREEAPVRRRQVLDTVLRWAENGHWLTTSDRPGQRLYVTLEDRPDMSALMWLDVLTLRLTAFASPYWEYETPAEVTCSGTGALPLPVTSLDAPVDCTVINQGSDVLTTLTLSAKTTLTFTGLALPAGGVFRLWEEQGVLHATAEGTSALALRTPESSDELLAGPGSNAVSVTADQPVLATFSARGRLV